MIKENITLTGRVELILTGPDSRIKERKIIDNLVVTTGKEFVAGRIAGTSVGVMTHIEVGTSSNPPTVNNTSLNSGIIGSRTPMIISGGTPSGPSVLFSALFGPTVGTGNIVEAGIFNASTGGTMLCHTVFSEVTKGPLDSLTINWTVTVN